MAIVKRWATAYAHMADGICVSIRIPATELTRADAEEVQDILDGYLMSCACDLIDRRVYGSGQSIDWTWRIQ